MLVRARLHYELACVQLSYGEFHKIVGGHPSLGNWDVDAAPEMSWSDGDTWRADVQLPANQEIEFKVRCNRLLHLSVRTPAREMVTRCAMRIMSAKVINPSPHTPHYSSMCVHKRTSPPCIPS